jgi:hypothetical protein
VDRPGVRGPPWTDTGVDRGRDGALNGAWPPTAPVRLSSPAGMQNGERSTGSSARASPELGQRCGSRVTVVQNREAAALGEDTAQACTMGKRSGERCGATRGWCSPFIGVGGAPGRKCRWVTAGDLRLTPLLAGKGVNGDSRGGIKAGEEGALIGVAMMQAGRRGAINCGEARGRHASGQPTRGRRRS